jgi:hypothetical protein
VSAQTALRSFITFLRSESKSCCMKIVSRLKELNEYHREVMFECPVKPVCHRLDPIDHGVSKGGEGGIHHSRELNSIFRFGGFFCSKERESSGRKEKFRRESSEEGSGHPTIYFDRVDDRCFSKQILIKHHIHMLFLHQVCVTRDSLVSNHETGFFPVGSVCLSRILSSFPSHKNYCITYFFCRMNKTRCETRSCNTWYMAAKQKTLAF